MNADSKTASSQTTYGTTSTEPAAQTTSKKIYATEQPNATASKTPTTNNNQTNQESKTPTTPTYQQIYENGHWYLINTTNNQKLTGFQKIIDQNKTVYYNQTRLLSVSGHNRDSKGNHAKNYAVSDLQFESECSGMTFYVYRKA